MVSAMAMQHRRTVGEELSNSAADRKVVSIFKFVSDSNFAVRRSAGNRRGSSLFEITGIVPPQRRYS